MVVYHHGMSSEAGMVYDQFFDDDSFSVVHEIDLWPEIVCAIFIVYS